VINCAPRMKQLILDFTPPSEATFAAFIVGDNTELLHALMNLVVDQPLPSPMLYMWGAPHSGKTHLLRALAHARSTPTAFLFNARESAQSWPDDALVLVDDVEALDEKEQQTLFNLYNERRHRMVVAGAAAPRHLPMREDLTSRLASGLVFQIRPLADEVKVDALVAHAKARGFELKRDVAMYLVERFQRDMGNLMHILQQLDEYSLAHHRAVTLPLVRAAVADALAA
jgi:DnaA-homolog protein